MSEYLKCPKCGENNLISSYRSCNQSVKEATVSFLCVWCHDCDFIQEASAFYRNLNVDAAQQNELQKILEQKGVRLGVQFL